MKSESIFLWDKTSSSKNIITEAQEDTNNKGEKVKHYHLKGIFMQAERENLNGRIYPLEEMTREVNKLSQVIEMDGGVLGELDHPEDLTVKCTNASHIIREIHMDGNNAVGDMQITEETPAGATVVGLMKAEAPLGVSSRGTGIVDDYDNTVSNFNLVTIDIVATPSAQGAKPMVIYENLRNSEMGKQILKNADNCIRSKFAYRDEFESDVVSWYKNWKPNRF